MFRRGRNGWYFDSDEKSGGGGGTDAGDKGAGDGDAKKDDGTASGNGGKDDTGQSGKGDGGSSAGQGRVQYTPEQQAEIDRLIGKARTDGRNAARREVEDKAKADQGKFQELYDSLNKRVVEELEPAAARLVKLAERLNAHIDAQIKEWPDSLKKQDPGKEDVEIRATWVERSADLAKELAAAKTAPNGEHGKGTDAAPTGPEALNKYLGGRYTIPGGKK